jgi:hypothetical protein
MTEAYAWGWREEARKEGRREEERASEKGEVIWEEVMWGIERE